MKTIPILLAFLTLLAAFNNTEYNYTTENIVENTAKIVDTTEENEVDQTTEPVETFENIEATIPAFDLTPAKEMIPFTDLTSAIEEEYVEAYAVYESLIEAGYSEAAACGIIGNMMVECGGQTLDLSPEAYSYGDYYYGICQWSPEYYPDVIGSSLEYQIEFLINTVEDEFDMFGSAFGVNYEEFMEIETPEEAARRFAQVYERCDSSTYGYREACAIDAYNYFVNG